MSQPKLSSMSSQDQRSPLCVHGDSSLVLATDPKPRLRWTLELHTRFVEAVTQLGGPDKATPKTIMRVMGVQGLTLFHLKSHLQKFRLGKLPRNEFTDLSNKHELRMVSSSNVFGIDTNDNSNMVDVIKMQMEAQRRLHEQLEVQRHVQLRMEAQGKYTQSILEKACETLVSENVGWGEASFSSRVPCFEDLLDLEEEPMEAFLPIDAKICLENTESSSSSHGGESQFFWSDGLQLHVLEMAAAAGAFQGDRIADLF